MDDDQSKLYSSVHSIWSAWHWPLSEAGYWAIRTNGLTKYGSSYMWATISVTDHKSDRAKESPWVATAGWPGLERRESQMQVNMNNNKTKGASEFTLICLVCFLLQWLWLLQPLLCHLCFLCCSFCICADSSVVTWCTVDNMPRREQDKRLRCQRKRSLNTVDLACSFTKQHSM